MRLFGDTIQAAPCADLAIRAMVLRFSHVEACKQCLLAELEAAAMNGSGAHTFSRIHIRDSDQRRLAHCQKIGIAIWVFIWMIDRTTKEVATEGGCAEGLVYGGRANRAREIGLELEMAARTVHAHIDRLVADGYFDALTALGGCPLATPYSTAKNGSTSSLLSTSRARSDPQICGPPAENCGGFQILRRLPRILRLPRHFLLPI